MQEILLIVGKTAGLGGLALGVFLLLFRQVKLPKGTRKHLTLFMWLVWSICVIALLIYFAVTQHVRQDQTVSQGAESSDKKTKSIPEWTAGIPITYPDEEERFQEFLNENNGRIVFLNTRIGCDLSNERSLEIGKQIGLLEDGRGSSLGALGNLPLDGNGYHMLGMSFLPGNEPYETNGGSGVIGFPFSGYFKVSVIHRTSHVLFLVEEVPVQFTVPIE